MGLNSWSGTMEYVAGGKTVSGGGSVRIFKRGYRQDWVALLRGAFDPALEPYGELTLVGGSGGRLSVPAMFYGPEGMAIPGQPAALKFGPNGKALDIPFTFF